MIKQKAIVLVQVSSGMLLGMLLGLTFIVSTSVF
jgi:hypothetical protein